MSTKRDTILGGASEVFRTEGFDSASMDRIAEVAGVSKRTIYNHFGSKDALFAAVVQQLIDQIHELKQVLWDPDKSLKSQLRAFAKAKSAAVDDPNWLALIRVALGVAIKRPEFARSVMQDAMRGEEFLVKWLQDADAAGKLRVPNPILASQLFWAMVGGALFWPQIFDAPMSDELRAIAADEVIETFLCRFRPR